MAGYTLKVLPSEHLGTWEGWGTSIAWWGVAVGDLDVLADALFTLNDAVQIPGTGIAVPGLGLNIVRYNVGGCGRRGDGDAVQTYEKNTADRWFKTVEGFWINWLSKDPRFPSYDWSRDARQRQAVQLALQRGLISHVELFHNAPMWWMTHEKTSFGGQLQNWNHSDFATYAANVAEYFVLQGWPVRSLEILNEPSAGWWNPGHGQEGCNVSHKVQHELLDQLSGQVKSRPSLGGVRISGVDENECKQAVASYRNLRPGLVAQFNVHGYDGGVGPNRDCGHRRALRETVHAHVPLWVSEYGDGEEEGMALAHSITEDLHHLRPTAWMYWQAVEACKNDGSAHGWGIINCHFGGNPEDPRRGTCMRVNNKFFIFAQFTRFLRPGMLLLGKDDHNSICAYDSQTHCLIVITLNWGNPQTITVDLSKFGECGGSGSCTFTNAYGQNKLSTSRFNYSGKVHSYFAEANSVYSLVFERVGL